MNPSLCLFGWLMESADWLRFLVTVAGVFGSVFGAHWMVRKRERRKEAADLFAKTIADATELRSALDELRTLILRKLMADNPADRIESLTLGLNSVLPFHNVIAKLDSDQILLSITIGKAADPIQEQITAYTECIKSEHAACIQIETLEAFGQSIPEVEKRLLDSYKELITAIHTSNDKLTKPFWQRPKRMPGNLFVSRSTH